MRQAIPFGERSSKKFGRVLEALFPEGSCLTKRPRVSLALQLAAPQATENRDTSNVTRSGCLGLVAQLHDSRDLVHRDPPFRHRVTSFPSRECHAVRHRPRGTASAPIPFSQNADSFESESRYSWSSIRSSTTISSSRTMRSASNDSSSVMLYTLLGGGGTKRTRESTPAATTGCFLLCVQAPGRGLERFGAQLGTDRAV